jgi:hypothetical protein
MPSDNPSIYKTLNEAIDAFNSQFGFVVNNNLVVRIDDLWTFSPSEFARTQYGNWFYVLDKSRCPAAQAWLDSPIRNHFRRMVYIPGQERILSLNDERVLNRSTGWGSTPKPGDVNLWIELLSFLFPDSGDRQHVESFLACLVQRPGIKIQHALFVHSVEQGLGKNLLFDGVGKAVFGNNYVQIEDKHLDSQFNDWQADKQFIVADEIRGRAKAIAREPIASKL